MFFQRLWHREEGEDGSVKHCGREPLLSVCDKHAVSNRLTEMSTYRIMRISSELPLVSIRIGELMIGAIRLLSSDCMQDYWKSSSFQAPVEIILIESRIMVSMKENMYSIEYFLLLLGISHHQQRLARGMSLAIPESSRLGPPSCPFSTRYFTAYIHIDSRNYQTLFKQISRIPRTT